MAESLAALIAWAGTEGAVFGGMTAAEAAAAGTAGTAAAGAGTAAAGAGAGYGAGGAAMYGAEGASAGLLSEGAYGAGTGATALTAEEIAAIQAMDGGAYGNALAGGPGGAADVGSGGHQFVSDFDKYKNFAQQGFKSLGKAYSKMPPGTTQLVSQGLLGGAGGSNAQTNVMPPPRGGGGQTSPMPGAPQNQLPQVTPYAPTVGGGDDQEMKKRLAMLRQAGLLGV